MDVHKRVRSIRESKGLNQIYLSSKIGLSNTSYSMKETGKRPFTIEELYKLSRVLDVPIAHFFEDEFHEKCNVI